MLKNLSRVGEATVVALAVFLAAPPATSEITVTPLGQDDTTGGDYQGVYGSCFSVVAQGSPTKQFPEIKIGPDFFTDDWWQYENRCTQTMVGFNNPNNDSGCTQTLVDQVPPGLIPNREFDDAVCVTEKGGVIVPDPVNPGYSPLLYFDFSLYRQPRGMDDPATIEDETDPRVFSFSFLPNTNTPSSLYDSFALGGGLFRGQVLPWALGDADNVFPTDSGPAQYNACLGGFRPSTFDNHRFINDPISAEIDLLTGGDATVAFYFLTEGLTCRELAWTLFVDGTEITFDPPVDQTIGDFSGGKYVVFKIFGMPEDGATVRLDVRDAGGVDDAVCEVAMAKIEEMVVDRGGDADNPVNEGIINPLIQARNAHLSGIFVDGTWACVPPTPVCDIEKATNGLDADIPEEGPNIEEGQPVAWTYVVSNDNDFTMTNIQVTDSKGEAVTCPFTELGPHTEMTCTANGTAVLGEYANTGFVTGDTDYGSVSCDDPSHYFGMPIITPEPVCTIEKSTNDDDADVEPGPEIPVGDAVLWTYEVTNENDVEMTNISLEDDKLGAIACPFTTLAPHTSMTCSANGTAVLGQYANLGTVTGETAWGDVTCDDPSHYNGTPEPFCTIQKRTNNDDADAAPGPEIEEGQPVLWTYEVTNGNDVEMTNISLMDDKLGPITCPSTTLAAGASMTCSANGTAVLGQYENLGTVTGETRWGDVTCEDPSHYFGTPTITPEPVCTIEKSTNGDDADAEPGPEIPVGDAVLWTYDVTNENDVEMINISLEDDKLGVITCPSTTLAPHTSMTCSANGTAVLGQYANLGIVTGDTEWGEVVCDDPSHYYGADEPGIAGCTPGYWKQRHHFFAWTDPYSPVKMFDEVFESCGAEFDGVSLLGALKQGGGGFAALGRHAVAALLNAASGEVGYEWSVLEVIDAVNTACINGDPDFVESLKDDLDEWNNRGCPLGREGR